MPNSQNDEEYGPRFAVWNHLHSGVDLAIMEFDALDEKSRKAVAHFGSKIVAARKAFALGKEQHTWIEIYDRLLEDAWFRHAAKIELAWEGIGRASEALDRFMELRPVLTDYRPGDRAAEYLREAVDTFLFGLDPACIALCGATLEQVLKDLVIAAGIYTEPRLRREQPSGHTLLENAKRAGAVVGDAYDAAKRIFDQRNRVMHRHIWDRKIIKNVALKTIKDLGAVLKFLGDR